MEEQIRALQEQVAALTTRTGTNPRPWVTKDRDDIRLYQGAVKCIPIFSGEKGESWRSHEKSLRVWFNANSVQTYSNLEQQKMAILNSLRGKALRAQELYGTGTDAYTAAMTFNAYLEKIRSVFIYVYVSYQRIYMQQCSTGLQYGQ